MLIANYLFKCLIKPRNANVFLKTTTINRPLANKRLTEISKYWVRYDYLENKNVYHRPAANPYMSTYYKVSPKRKLMKPEPHLRDIFLL